MSDQPLQVFVSSKMQELAAERAAIKAALDEMEIEAFVFEDDAGAQAQSIQQTFLQGVETSDLYVGLFWKGYGPYTIEEFEHARRLGMDCLIYEKREGEGAGRDPQLQQFLDEVGAVETGLTARWFHSVDGLRTSVKKDVARWQARIIRERLSTIKPTLYVGVPSMPNHFVGRDEIMAEMVGQLRSGEDQALSAAGLAGVGKTTLAVALCRHKGVLRHFTGGVLWGGLGTQPDVASILTRWAEALGRDISGLATDAAKSQAVGDAIGTRRMLIVIDDAWDLAPARLLQCGGPGCSHVLTTRNEAIAQDFAGLHSQRAIPVLAEEKAYQLLYELAPAVCKDDEASARALTASLGGLPLAIELVGSYLGASRQTKFRSQRDKARAVASDPHERLQLATARLGTRAAAQVSLQAVIELSLEALEEEAVGAFYALGAFAPKPEAFGLAAAEAVTEVEAETMVALSILHLVDVSEEEQLSLHQVVASVAREGMDAEAVARHRRYYLALLNEDQEDWRRIAQVYGQVKWAWEGAREYASFKAFINAARTYQRRRGLLRDELAWYNRVLKEARAVENRWDETIMLDNIGRVYDRLGQWQKALQYYKDSLKIAVAVKDRVGESITLNNIGAIYLSQGRHEEALQYYKESLKITVEEEDRAGEARTLNNIGQVYDRLGQHEEALGYYEASLTMKKELGDRVGEAKTLNNIGAIYHSRGRHEEALRYYEDSLTIKKELGDRVAEAVTLSNIGAIYHSRGRHEEALRCAKASLTISMEVEDRAGEAKTLSNIAAIYHSRGRHEEALSFYERTLPIQQEVGERAREADTLTNIGAVYFGLGLRQEALFYLERALTIRQEMGDRAGESSTRYSMAGVYRAQGALERAVTELRAVVELDRQVQHPDLESDLALLKKVEAEWAARGT